MNKLLFAGVVGAGVLCLLSVTHAQTTVAPGRSPAFDPDFNRTVAAKPAIIDIPHDPDVLRKLINAKKADRKKYVASRKAAQDKRRPNGGENDCSRCGEIAQKCNDWQKNATEVNRAICDAHGDCPVPSGEISKDDLCPYISNHECHDLVLKSRDQNYVHRCWLTGRQDAIDSLTADIYKLDQEIALLEGAYADVTYGRNEKIEEAQTPPKSQQSKPAPSANPPPSDATLSK